MSTAAEEAFGFLNELTRRHYRGRGDTSTAARDRAARAAGITPAQAERLWKRWDQMTTVNGDVYRALRNQYEALCRANGAAADAFRAERLELKAARHAAYLEPASAGVGEGTALDRAVPRKET